ncbi:MAG: ribosome-associated translation inhibitor RaiA [Oligoflexia bacterium]|nr:ribosome-associated translation inhibitor RaiA [Oligoflexia bacterium]
MQTKFTFKKMEALESIKDYALNRINKMEKFALHKEPRVHFIFSVQKADQIAEVTLDAGQHHYAAKAKDPVLYAAIDKVVDKLERQLMKHKEKVQAHHDAELSNEGYLRRELALQADSKRTKQRVS